MIDPARLLRRVPGQLGRVSVAFDGHTAEALLTTETVEEDGGGHLAVAVQREVLTYAAGELPGLKRKSALTVGGANRTVAWDRPMDGNTLYPLLRRLEKQGLLASAWNTDEPRPRKYYETTALGDQMAASLVAEWQQLNASLSDLRKGQSS